MAFQVFLRIKNDGKVNDKIEIQGNEILFKSPEHKLSRYKFQHIFDQQATQHDVFKTVVHPLVLEAFTGSECCVLAHGVSGSGKTYTVQGRGDDCTEMGTSGIIKRSCYQAFGLLRGNMMRDSEIYISYFEIYREKVYDLLSESNDPISIRDDARGETHLVHGIRVEDLSASLRYAELGMKNRRKKATAINFDSSRSHSVFSLRFKHNSFETSGTIRIVDLAGMETLTLSDSRQISLSLTSLVDVIQALSKKNQHIPFRNSVLTRVLKKSFIGNAMNAIVCTLSMDKEDIKRTLDTVKFGATVGLINSTFEASSQSVEERMEMKLQEEMRIYEELMEQTFDGVTIRQLKEERDRDFREIAEMLKKMEMEDVAQKDRRREMDAIQLENEALEKEIEELKCKLRETDEIEAKLKEEAKEAIELIEQKFNGNSNFFENIELINETIEALEKFLDFNPQAKLDDLKRKGKVYVSFKNLVRGNEESEELREMRAFPDLNPRLQEILQHLRLLRKS